MNPFSPGKLLPLVSSVRLATFALVVRCRFGRGLIARMKMPAGVEKLCARTYRNRQLS